MSNHILSGAAIETEKKNEPNAARRSDDEDRDIENMYSCSETAQERREEARAMLQGCCLIKTYQQARLGDVQTTHRDKRRNGREREEKRGG